MVISVGGPCRREYSIGHEIESFQWGRSNPTMSIAASVATFVGRALAPCGDLTCAVLFERSLIPDLPEAPDPRRPAVLRLATEADIDGIARLYAGDPWLYLGEGPATPDTHDSARRLYLDRLRRGELCFLAVSGDTIAHINWICFSWGDFLPEQPIRLHRGEVYTTDGLTLPAFRGHGLHAFVLRAMLAHARERGYAHAYTLGREDRPAALKGLAQLGWSVCGRVVYFLPRGGTKAWFLGRQGNVEPLFRSA
jgi:GNAT superfamily N-acetyltransferase